MEALHINCTTNGKVKNGCEKPKTNYSGRVTNENKRRLDYCKESKEAPICEKGK